MTDFSPVFNAHPEYIESLYKNWQANPASVESDWQAFFRGFDFASSATNGHSEHSTTSGTAATNDLKKEFGETVAEIVYAVSNEKGKNRKERANNNYYLGIRKTAWATFVKLCDRLANIKYSSETKSRMLQVYQKEQEKFIDCLLPLSKNKGQYTKLIEEMNSLLAVTKV